MSLAGREGQFGEMSKVWDDRVMAGHLNLATMVNYMFSSVQLLSRVRLFATP